MKTNRTSPEILAPAGSPEALQAALDAGAHAIYLGLDAYNARSLARNFSISQLAQYMPIVSQEYGAKIYVTLNTVLKMNEIDPVLRILEDLAAMGVHGIIFQDLGLAKILKDHFPQLRRHASTQLAIHNLEGVQFCEKLGIQRVVLARELTLKELRLIRKACPPERIELEVFCHGAMCYTYSGLCLFSGAVGGRSGNRGACAYTCRKGYRIHNNTAFPEAAPKGSYDNYLFSMKDMNTLDMLEAFIDVGIDSLKIEGRRKGPDYVGSTVKAYRSALNGRRDPAAERESNLAFGRQYTRAFYQRGQYGDAPINPHASGTQGIHLGTIDSNQGFTLKEEGIERRDGISLIFPDHKEKRMSFMDYRVVSGMTSGRRKESDSHHPKKGSRIQLLEPVPEGTEVFWIKSHQLEHKYRPQLPALKPVNHTGMKVHLELKVNEATLSITYSNSHAQASRELPWQASRNGKPTPLKSILARYGDSTFFEGGYKGEEHLEGFIPKSILKQTRRDLLNELHQSTLKAKDQHASRTAMSLEIPMKKPRRNPYSYILKSGDIQLLSALDAMLDSSWSFDIPAHPSLNQSQWKLARDFHDSSRHVTRFSLPMVLREGELKIIRHRLETCPETEWSLANPGQIVLFKQRADRLHADFSLYSLNHWAFNAWREYGISGRICPSIEDDHQNLNRLIETVDTELLEWIAYTDIPLFIAEACSLAALYGECPGTRVCQRETLHIENEHGDLFQIQHDRCRSIVLSDEAYSLTGELDSLKRKGIQTFRVDVHQKPYTFDQARAIVEAVINDQKLTGTHTENFNRTLV